MSAPTMARVAEQSVLGALLGGTEALDRVSSLRPEHFADGLHRRIFGAIQRLSSSSKVPVTPLAVADSLGGEADEFDYVNALALSVASASGIERHAALVREAAQHRRLREAIEQATEIADGPDGFKSKVDAIAALLVGLESAVAREPRRLAEIAVARTAHYERLASGEVEAGWATGLPTLDRCMAGGLKPGKLVILAARPSVGKSSLSMQMLIQQGKRGRTGLYLSMEMDGEEQADRVVAAEAEIDGVALATGKLADDDWTRAVEALTAMGDLPVWVDDQPALGLQEIRSKVRRTKGIKVLVVDYLQLCRSSMTRENRTAQVGEISRGLKALAMDAGICVVALSQLNREVEKRPGKRPQLSDLRDSGEIEQDADSILFLWPLSDPTKPGEMTVGMEIAKQRGGTVGACVMNFNRPHQRWHESTLTVDEAIRLSNQTTSQSGDGARKQWQA
jgi:replicative DNA helicase